MLINKEYTLQNGDTFRLNDGLDWVVINSNQSATACCACVVSVRNAPDGIPHFLVFTKKPVRELSRQELDAIDQKIVEVYSAYQTILDSKVEPIFKNGRCINAEEHLKNPYPGYFDLASWPNYWSVGPTTY